jgi:hypothetical protein
MSRICYIYKTNCRKGHFHFFCRPANITFVSSCEFNGLVSKSCRIPPAALFFSEHPATAQNTYIFIIIRCFFR